MYSNKITRSQCKWILHVHAILVSHSRLSSVPRRMVSPNDVMVLHCLFGKTRVRSHSKGLSLILDLKFPKAMTSSRRVTTQGEASKVHRS